MVFHLSFFQASANGDIVLVFAVKLPELLAYVNIEEETLTRLQQKLLDFLKYRPNPLLYCVKIQYLADGS